MGRTLTRGEKGEILDRLEIFNSVQVRAPAIDLDQTKNAEKGRDLGKFLSGRRGSSVSLYIFYSGALYYVKIVFCVYTSNTCYLHLISTVFFVLAPLLVKLLLLLPLISSFLICTEKFIQHYFTASL